MYYIGLDIGSTTTKIAILNDQFALIDSIYRRHFSNIEESVVDILKEVYDKYGDIEFKIKVTGSSGLTVSSWLKIDFIQEVIACSKAIKKYYPQTDVVVELGGEDAKLTFFEATIDQRMNGSCAGGTGAFIDQMAKLLNVSSDELNELAKSYQKLYPIAARCGVFAKTDIQPLINEGVRKEDIAASIYQAVVNQTIAGLSAGKTIKGNVAFLGGPLSFSSELRNRFIQTLNLKDEQVIFPDNAMLYVALGCAVSSEEVESRNLLALIDATQIEMKSDEVSQSLDPLFNSDQEYQEFLTRHQSSVVPRSNEYAEGIFIGIDAGSTTSKMIAINTSNQIVYSNYQSNKGEPLKNIIEMLKDLYITLGSDVKVLGSCSTGYGELLIQNAFKLHTGEIETMCHYNGAAYFNKDVDFILDIGGQDMKCMRIKDGVIYDIMLNEACSSGCGSFIESFAKTMNVEIEDFAHAAVTSKQPTNLGSRCTVFMNSKVKQVQKEGASVADISAGLSYSVIKNVLVKVIKENNYDKLGKNIVVSGGTFYNDGVLRAFEKMIGKEVIKPDISGLMGAFGAALISKEHMDENKKIITYDELMKLTYETVPTRCKLCENKCSLTINKFSDNTSFISGNKCDRPTQNKTKGQLPNVYAFKYERLFDYPQIENAKRGDIGIPRVLNIYEHYPFWYGFFTSLGFNVVLSPRSNKKVFEEGMSSITSDTICYPAKLVHGHVQHLLNSGINTIFYPSVPFEAKERINAKKNYNCPIVTSYPEVIKNNVDDIKNVRYLNPFLDMSNMENMLDVLYDQFKEFGVMKTEITQALKIGDEYLRQYQFDIKQAGQDAFEYATNNNLTAIVLAGRPYHIDPEINHGLDKLITDLGMVVLSEDSIVKTDDQTSLWAVDQWVYHSRVYSAAEFATKHKHVEFVQLTSFGCGIDAIVSEQAKTILEDNGNKFTLLKIDEGENLGAIKIRLRSLQSVAGTNLASKDQVSDYKTPDFTKEMRNHTILVPQMSPVHFNFIETALQSAGYNVQVLKEVSQTAVELGESYVNNDTCYPSIIVIGQLIEALQSGEYDLENTSLMISQTGGGCRASNYISLLRRGLAEAGYENVPVISFNSGNIEDENSMNITPQMVKRLLLGVTYGDLLLRITNKSRAYEINKGETDRVLEEVIPLIQKNVEDGSYLKFRKNIKKIVKKFDIIELSNEVKPKVGIVGEILVKYHPSANNQLVKVIEENGGEAVIPELVDFFLYTLVNAQFRYENLYKSKKKLAFTKVAIKAIETYRRPIKKALVKSKNFESFHSIDHTQKNAQKMLSLGNQTGEGWFLTGEMVNLIEDGVNNIICTQPFGCLPNHITGKGMFKKVRENYEDANIVAIDYDPGASEVNQINRIKLMMTVAKRNLD